MSVSARRRAFRAVRSEGGLLPDDFLQRLAAGDPRVEGLAPEAFHLAGHERVGDLIDRSWSRLLGSWRALREALAALPQGDAALRVTRERWLLPLFQELGYGRLLDAAPLRLGEREYPISHLWHGCPIHLLGAGVPLDRRTPGVVGAAQSAPHGLVQALLNRSDAHLWGFVSNGLVLRLLRDCHSLTRQAFIELDLAAMLDGELFHEFALLWLLCHQSRVEPREAGRPQSCWLERWFARSRDEGVRALERLRQGVARAIETLGQGLLRHPANTALHDALAAGHVVRATVAASGAESAAPSALGLSVDDFYRQLLRLIYRLIFLFVAEDRELLLDPQAPVEARRRYREHYSTARLRRLAERHRGGAHPDLWRALRLVMSQLEQGCAALGLPALGTFLWRAEALPHVLGCELGNEHLLGALRSLCFVSDGGLQRQVSFEELGADELGSVYEALLELHPRLEREAGRFELDTAAGHERKTSGSYYTPSSLVEQLLDTALDPVLERAATQPHAEAAILALKVCDPACGSGHFLVAAARRIARRLAALRTGDDEPSPEALREALRDVVGHCLYGVDLNPMAVELCKVSLWMEALEAGKPLSFLDAHIQCGNALLGTTPALMARGIPDEAFTALTGDDKAVATRLRQRNRHGRRGQQDLFAAYAGERGPADELPQRAAAIEHEADDTIAAVGQKERHWGELTSSYAYRDERFRADAWCAAFLWPKQAGVLEDAAPTQELWRRLLHDPAAVPQATRAEVRRLARQHALLHWHLAFPTVFEPLAAHELAADSVTGWRGGFDVVLGNPPWERLKLQEKEFFATRDRDVAEASNAAARKRAIAALGADDPQLLAAWHAALRQAEGESHLVRLGGRYPLCGRGDINTYAVFAELNRTLVGEAGRVGCILPAGIATDDTTKLFFQDLVDRRALASLYHFENEDFVFPAVHHAVRFCLLTLAGAQQRVEQAELVGYARQVGELRDPARRYTLCAEDFALLNPNTRTLPVFRWARDAELTKAIYRRVPVLLREGDGEDNPWGVRFMRMLDMANDSGLFRTREQLEARGFRLSGNRLVHGSERYLPLYEAKMVHHFDHRFGTYAGQTEAQARQGKLPEADAAQHADAAFLPLPRYWVAESEVEQRLAERWDRGWLLGWRDICRTSDTRTVIAAVVSRVATGDTYLLALSGSPLRWCLSAILSAFVVDFVARQKVGGTHLKYHVFKQLAVLPPTTLAHSCPFDHAVPNVAEWLRPRVLELTYTAWDLAPFARDCGYEGPPFRWDAERRFLLRCELDAAFFHLYGIARDAVDYIMDSFWVVRQKDEKAYGAYRTKLQILDLYDRLAQATASGEPYRTRLDPPPADPRVAHAARPERDLPRAPAPAPPNPESSSR